MRIQNYYRPDTLDKALSFDGNVEKTIFLAGGTDIFVKAGSRDWYSGYSLIDIGGLKELQNITVTDYSIEIGSCVKLSDICSNDIIVREAPILAKACSEIGSPQIRNQGTIGGNIANACLAGDAIPALCVLGAEIRVANGGCERMVPVEKIMKPCPACLNHEGMCVRGCYYGVPAGKKTVLGENDLIISVVIPRKDDRWQYFFQKVGRKEALTMSDFTLAVALKAENGLLLDMKISIGAALDRVGVEDWAYSEYIGKTVVDDDLKKISKALAEKILNQKKITDSIKYKAIVCENLTYRTLRAMIYGEGA